MESVLVGTPIAVHDSQGRGLDVIQEPDLRRLADYWHVRRRDRRMPRRTDIDPIDIPWALSRIYLVDYEADSQTFRYRLAGGEIEDTYRPYTNGLGLKGKTFKDILPEAISAQVHENWMPLVDEQTTLYMYGQIYRAESRRAIGARIILPLSDEDDTNTVGAVGLTKCTWEFSDNLVMPQLEICRIPLDEIA